MEIILKYFPTLPKEQLEKIVDFTKLFIEWNSKVNLISRKDIESIYEKHILHSLSINKFISFNAGADILDVGTGGGFPGLPLAITNEDANFMLVDSIGKKIAVVNDISSKLGINNVTALQTRAENVNKKFDFVVSRAVTAFPNFVPWVRKSFKKQQKHAIKNGIIYLKGGDISEEIAGYKATVTDISNYFEEDFFETKKIVYLPVKAK